MHSFTSLLFLRIKAGKYIFCQYYYIHALMAELVLLLTLLEVPSILRVRLKTVRLMRLIILKRNKFT